MIRYTWYESSDFKNLSPITQVYGFCFTSEGRLMIVKGDKDWTLPRGTPETDESLEETLKREIWEEARITIEKCEPVGYQKVEYPGNPDKSQGELFYQARYACLIKRKHNVKKDPATGVVFKRKFINPGEFSKYVKWRKRQDMVKAAMKKL